MTKIIVETRGDFLYLNSDLKPIHAHKPTVTRKTHLVEELIANAKITTLANSLPDEASDEEFQAVLAEYNGDETPAIVAYCALYGVDTEGNEITVEKKAEKSDTKTKEAETPAKNKSGK